MTEGTLKCLWWENHIMPDLVTHVCNCIFLEYHFCMLSQEDEWIFD